MSGSSGSSGGCRGSTGSPPIAGVALNPKSLLRRHNLPIAAHLHTPNAPPGLDLARPLLLYTNYTSTKVRAVSLRTTPNGSLQPIGPPLVIPDSYTGWFAVVRSDGRTAPYYSTVEQLAAANLTFFLTRYDVPAYIQYEDDLGRYTYDRTVIQSGHVLKLLGVFEDLNARRGMFSPRDANNVFSCDKYAQCLNYRNQVVFLPFTASGRFYAPAHKSSKDPNHVYLMTQLLKNHRLPVTVRLVCGYMPRVPCSFTGVLRLEKARKEAVILACTMTSEAQATLLEIEVTSNFVLSPIMDHLFTKTPIYLKTVSYCQDEADGWRRQIKVTHHVTESRSRSLTRSLSDKFVESLTRPLNLSFLADLDRRRNSSKERSKDISKKDTNKWQRHSNNKDSGKYTISDKSFYRRRTKEPIKSNNAYVLQAPIIHRSLPAEPIEEIIPRDYSDSDSDDDNGLYNKLSKSVDNIDYCRVLDDISPIPEKSEIDEDEILTLEDRLSNISMNDTDYDKEIEEDHYAEICEIAPPINPNMNSLQNDIEKISHVDFDSEDSGSNKTAHLDFDEDRSLEQISLELFERECTEMKSSNKLDSLTHDEIRELGGTPSMLDSDNSGNNSRITVEAVIHENKENENIERNMKIKNDQTNINKTENNGKDVSLITIGNYDIPKNNLNEPDSLNSSQENLKAEEQNVSLGTHINYDTLISALPVDDLMNSIKKNKCILNVSNKNNKESSANQDFNGNQIKIVLTGNTIVIKVKDEEDDESIEDNEESTPSKTLKNEINANITKTVLSDDLLENRNSHPNIENDANYQLEERLKEINFITETNSNKVKEESYQSVHLSSCTPNSHEEYEDSSENGLHRSNSDLTESSDIQDDNDSDTSSLISVSDSGIYFIKLKGFELPESEIGKALSGNAVHCYDSLC